jgi:AcrR family transcriptional regulator
VTTTPIGLASGTTPRGTRSRARTRDPERRQLILNAAADLLARNGFHSVTLADIGAEAGISGPGIYRHFEGKGAILVALLNEAVDALLHQEEAILRSTHDPAEALRQLVAGQVDFVVGRRELAQVYYTEIRNLAERDRAKLRRKQRLYVEAWVQLLSELRPQLDEASVRTIVHAAIGAAQSTLFHRVRLPDQRLRALLVTCACEVLGTSQA